jgi:hypothetical protein
VHWDSKIQIVPFKRGHSSYQANFVHAEVEAL